MPRTRSFRSRGGGRGGRRKMEWIGAVSSSCITLLADTSSVGYLVLPSVLRASFTDPTLVRIRGFLAWEAQATSVLAAFGIIRWADPDDTPPTTSIPNPYASMDLDWIYHRYLLQCVGATTDLDAPGGNVGGFEIDSKAMRKIGSDHGILYVVTNSVNSSSSLRFSLGVRCLFKE